MIAGRRFLLEAALMLLVDNNETELTSRGEHGAASADYHLNFAIGHAPPMSRSLRASQMAVQHCHILAPGLKSLNGLRRQADFGNQDQRFLALANDMFHGPQIDFGLAAAGDSVQEKR